MNPFSSFITLFKFLAFLIAIHGTTAQNLIDSTCENSAKTNPNINYNFCKTSFQAFPGSQTADLRGLGLISIQLIQNNVTDTKNYVKKLISTNKNKDSYYRQCLSDCLELFSDAISSAKDARNSYKDKRFDDANIQISSIMDDETTCEDGFQEKEGLVSPLTKRNEDTFQLSAIALSVMKMVQTGSN